jgi:hypothetical protein
MQYGVDKKERAKLHKEEVAEVHNMRDEPQHSPKVFVPPFDELAPLTTVHLGHLKHYRTRGNIMGRKARPVYLTVEPSDLPHEEQVRRLAAATEILLQIARRSGVELTDSVKGERSEQEDVAAPDLPAENGEDV